MKVHNIYLILAAVCAILLCCFSPVYFQAEEDPTHYFTMDFASIHARTFDADSKLVLDDTFTYATIDDAGNEVDKAIGASIMSVWALSVLTVLMAIFPLVVFVWGFFVTKVKDMVMQVNLNILTLVCVIGYYAMLAMYVAFAVARFDFEWHLAWPVCLPLIVLVLTLMAMRAFSHNAKKVKRDLSGSIR